MKIIVLLVLAILTVGFWLAVDQNSSDGKKPSDEILELSQYRNLVTGELRNVETVKCRLCGQVLSQTERSINGKVRAASYHQHHCGKYAMKPIARSMFYVPDGNLYDWLERWQRRLRFKH